MKIFTLVFVLLLSLAAYTQEGSQLVVSMDKQNIQASLTTDNSNNTIVVHSNTRSADHLKIKNNNWDKEKDYKRSFEIFDSLDHSLLKIPASNQFSYQVSVKQLRSSLKKGSTGSLYTIAIPRDPKVAATVRVRRVLICKINVK